MEFNYERIKEGFCERAHLIEWNVSTLLERGKFLPLLHSWTAKKFNSSANFAVSSKTKSIAVISSDGELNIMQVKDDKLVLKSQVRVLTDPYPEFRLIEWNSTETLLFATRSSAVMDVFEANGMFLYKIPMLDDVNGSLQIISQIRANPLTDELFSDDVYTLQIDGTFASFRVGKEAYHRLFTVNLGHSPLCSMVYVKRYNILISCGEFQQSKQSENGMDSSSFGINIHRILNGYPYVDLIKQSGFKKAWHERIPFLSDKKSIIICAEISPDQNTLLAVTSTGELLQFTLPSLRLIQSTVPQDEKIVPIQVSWISEGCFVVLHSNGQITRANSDEYFNGVYNDYKLNHLDACKRIHALDDSTIYALTEVRLDNIVPPEENKQRVGAELSLFVIFHLSFLLKLLKAFFSFFFGGDAIHDLNEKLGIEQSAQLSIFTTKNLSLSDYIEKCMYNRNYQLAITLAESSKNAYDLDIIYKRQWEDLKQSRSVSKEHLEVLRSVHDKIWVVEECLRLDYQTSISLHEDLLTLAAIVVKKVDNEKLRNRVLNASQILGIIRQAITRDEDACELYLKFRNSTILAFSFAVAQDTNFDLLKCLFARYRKELHNYILLLLNAIPETTEPNKYAEFLPYLNESMAPNGSFILNKSNDFIPADITKVPAKYVEYSDFLLGQNGEDEIVIFEKWAKQRVDQIDVVSGLEDDCVLFLRTVIDHGFDNLLDLYTQYSFYAKFVLFSNSTTITFKQFINSDEALIQSTLASHMTKSSLLENLQSVVELIEFADKGKGKAVEQILSLVCAHSIQGFEVLYALKQIRPGMLNTENLIQCLICSEVVGEELTKAMKYLDLPSGLVVVVESCAQVKSDDSLTFSEIHSAINDSNKAAKLIQRFIHGSCASIKSKTDEWWRDLLSKSRNLKNSAFEKVVSDEFILKHICNEMLNCVTRDVHVSIPASRQAPFHLVVDLSGTGASANISLLKQSVFEELIVEKSKDYLDSAIPELDDVNLKRASIVLEALRTGFELGSNRVPATFAYCSKEILLSEIAKKNYKNVKACAEVAKLLELSTPSARALAECAVCAFKQNDIKTVKNYIQQLSKSAKDFPVVYEMAKSILENKLDDEELNDDAIACLIHNCQENELNTALRILSDYRNNKSTQRPMFDSKGSAYPDPTYTSIKRLHLFDFDSVDTPLKIPLHTHQSDAVMTLENDIGSKERVEKNYELKAIVEALRILQERGVHPYILENLNREHYMQIAVKLAQYQMDDDLDD